MLRVKRIYDTISEDDGFRILVDRLWPRGMSKERAKVDLWLKDIAPSNRLRKWFGHDQQKWSEFKEKYYEELGEKGSPVALVLDKMSSGNVTLLFGAKEGQLNNAVALREYLTERQRSQASQERQMH
ncbi:MAG: DUF488 domain-containing protein [Dehalococcoidales bacterium]|nr:DUF488 domain-containing protein [Dehalococcoidales bacterium]